MLGWDDYYRILQVHYIAEPEVIESAYRRLAKKYHPDVNKSIASDLKMKQINIAYDILKDSVKRKKYDADLLRKQDNTANEALKQETDSASCISATTALTEYFNHIKNKNFSSAYKLISSMDKHKISLEDFLKWQNIVSKIFRIQDFECKASKTDQNIELNGLIYKQGVEFIIVTVEHNILMNRSEKDIFKKIVVLDKDGWRIYIGYEDVKPHIAKLEELEELLAAKLVISEMVELYSNIDNLTGLLNKKGFIEAAEKEVWRYGRYGNIFSLMLLEIDCSKVATCDNEEMKRCSVAWAGQLLKDSIRKLDIIGRWGETGFIILMPETELTSMVKVAVKIREIFETREFVYDNITQKVTVIIGIDEFKDTLASTIEMLNHHIDVAKSCADTGIVHLEYPKI